MTSITWCSPHPNHYNSYLFRAIQTQLNVPLRVVYFADVLQKYPWKTNFDTDLQVTYLKHGFFKNFPFIYKSLTANSLLIIAGWNNPTMMILLSLCRIVGKKYVLVTDTPDNKIRTGFFQMLRKMWLDFILFGVAKIFVTGKKGVKYFVDYGIDENRIVNFPFVTDLTFFQPIAKEAKSVINIISSGRLDLAHKGYDTGLAGLGKLKLIHPELRFTYTIAGTGPDKEKIEELIKLHNLEPEIALFGWMEPSDLPKFYASADVLLHPSNFDPFPNAVLEAMASGTAVIGSDLAGSVVERVQDGVNGFVFEGKNPDSLYEKLKLYFELDTNARQDLGKNARLTAEQWSVDYNLEQIRKTIV